MTVQFKRIGDCAEILPGLSLKARAEHEPDGTYQVIQAKHLKQGVPYIFNKKEHELRITSSKKMDRYIVNSGDILFISRGVRNEAVLVDKVPQHSVASSAFYIIRGNQGVETGYLAWVLEQPEIKAKVAQARTGAGMPLVQRSELMEMTIPVPDINTQQKFAALNRLMANERQILDQINQHTQLLHQSVGAQLFKEMKLG